jgi:ribosomal protein S18 acetylase RimI-like enzyme
VVRSEFPLSDLLYEAEASSQLWELPAGRAIAAALLYDHTWLLFVLHPDAVGTVVETQVIDWANARALQFALTSGQAVRLWSQAREDDPERLTTLERQGFIQDENYSLRMARPLDQPIPEPQLPAGFTVRPFSGEKDADAWAALWNDTAPGRTMTREQCLSWRMPPDCVPDLDLIAVAPDGTFAAYCMCSISEDETVRTGHRDGWTDPIGTREGFRRRGLARALVSTGLRGLKERGRERALLGVSGDNSPAIRLYESLGYKPLYKKLRYSRPVTEG